MQPVSRRRFVQTGIAAGAIGFAGCLGDDDDDDPADTDDTDDTDQTDTEPDELSYEIWALDQGTDHAYIYEPTEDSFEEIASIDFHEADGVEPGDGDNIVPHMIAYSSDYEYAAIACTVAGQTVIVRTEDYEVIAALDTGPGSHFAGFTPEDDGIVVDVIGTSEIVKVDADLDSEDFTIADEIEIDSDIEGLTDEEGAPICHSYDHQGRSIHTLGPSYHNAGIVIVDHEDFSVDTAFSGEELPTNCGTMPHYEDEKFYLTAGLPTPTDEDGEPIEGEEGVGDYYVLDTETDEILVESASTEGIDAHGFWFTPDGSELWILNRETNDGVVIDPDDDAVIDEIDAFGPATGDDPNERDAPDIMWASPDGDYMFVTLRGPVPLSGDPHAATGVTPGVAVLDIDTRDIVEVIEPDPIEDYSDEEIQAALDEEEDAPEIPDFHGVGVRPTTDVGDAITSPPF